MGTSGRLRSLPTSRPTTSTGDTPARLARSPCCPIKKLCSPPLPLSASCLGRVGCSPPLACGFLHWTRSLTGLNRAGPAFLWDLWDLGLGLSPQQPCWPHVFPDIFPRAQKAGCQLRSVPVTWVSIAGAWACPLLSTTHN